MKRKKANTATGATRKDSFTRHILAGRTASKRDRNILKLLIVIDASEASRRVLEYIGHPRGCGQLSRYDRAALRRGSARRKRAAAPVDIR
jgi:ribosomal protein L35